MKEEKWKIVYRNDKPEPSREDTLPAEETGPAGIYLHWPFCVSRCSYCHFHSYGAAEPDLIRQYLQALIREISHSSIPAPYAPCVYETIYFGGGTPSLIPPRDLAYLLNALHKRFPIAADAEITLEMNPESVHSENLHAYKRLGVNRLSLGIQSFNAQELSLLGRPHTSEQAVEAFRRIRQAGFENVSCDLIGGIPGQTLKKWQANLEKVLSLNPEHISLYLLEVHLGTPLDIQLAQKGKRLPSEKSIVSIYKNTLERCKEAGFEQYEISNFCRPGRASRHNGKYWKSLPILGFGLSSHYSIGRWRFENPDNLEDYLMPLEASGEVARKSVLLDEATWLVNYAITAFRLRQGIHLEDFRKRYGFSFEERYAEIIDSYLDSGMLEMHAGALRLVEKAQIISNEILQDFLEPKGIGNKPTLRLV